MEEGKYPDPLDREWDSVGPLRGIVNQGFQDRS